MSYCQREATGKDKSVFVTKEDVRKTEMVKELVEEDIHGVILPNGEINWDCPCLGALPFGPCGEEFKAAFSCFHFSEDEEKGVDCIPQFQGMQACFIKHPEEYSKYADDEQEGSGESPREDPKENTSTKSNSSTESGNESKTESSSESESKLESVEIGSDFTQEST